MNKINASISKLSISRCLVGLGKFVDLSAHERHHCPGPAIPEINKQTKSRRTVKWQQIHHTRWIHRDQTTFATLTRVNKNEFGVHLVHSLRHAMAVRHFFPEYKHTAWAKHQFECTCEPSVCVWVSECVRELNQHQASRRATIERRQQRRTKIPVHLIHFDSVVQFLLYVQILIWRVFELKFLFFIFICRVFFFVHREFVGNFFVSYKYWSRKNFLWIWCHCSLWGKWNCTIYRRWPPMDFMHSILHAVWRCSEYCPRMWCDHETPAKRN